MKIKEGRPVEHDQLLKLLWRRIQLLGCYDIGTHIFLILVNFMPQIPPPVWFTLKQATTILLHIFMQFTWLWIIFSILKGTPVIFCRIFIFHENWVFVKIISFSLKLAYEVQKLATLSHILPMAGLQILPNGYFLSKFVQKRTKVLPLPQILEKRLIYQQFWPKLV